MQIYSREGILLKVNGWIIYNGSLQGDSFLDYAKMLQEAMAQSDSHAKIIPNTEIPVLLQTNQSDIIHNQNVSKPDYVLFTDKDIYLARQLEWLGLKLFNKAETIAVCDDKIATYQNLAKAGIPIPKTIVSPKVFQRKDHEKVAYIDAVIKELQFPMIVKEAFGSFGEQVYLVHNKPELLDIVHRLHGKAFMFQEFIQTSHGMDIRLQVVGNQVVSAMKRIAKDDFRANVTAGAYMEAYQPTHAEKELAVAAAKSVHADFAGVDLLFGKTGPVVCEINSNAHIRNLLDCTGINAADFIADHVLHSVASLGEDR